MAFYFLPSDIKALEQQIAELEERIREIGRDMGESCREGAETFHDNFAHEEGERQQQLWSRRVRELKRIRDQARVVMPAGPSEFVRIGRTVRLAEPGTGKELTVRIGSYVAYGSRETVSYTSPLARLLIGAQEGELVEGRLGDRDVAFEVLEVVA